MSNYHRQFGIGLLDDLHNYFPALIYEPDAFRDFADVLFYVRDRARQEFDLFSAGQRTYVSVDRTYFPSSRRGPVGMGAQRTAAAAAPPPAAAAVPPIIPRQHLWNNVLGNSNRTTLAPIRYLWEENDVQAGDLGLLSGLMSLMMNPGAVSGAVAATNPNAIPPNFMEPVPVVPTAAQIAAGSAIEIVDAEEDTCPICQDTMAAGSNARSLNACDHRFHVGCIDTWFRSSVRCPVCRHDIREPAADHADLSGNEAPPSPLTEEEYREL